MKSHFYQFIVWGVLMLSSQGAWPYNLPPEFINLKDLPHVTVDLRYATTNNFMKKNVYGDFKETFLHQIAYDKFKKAGENLARRHRGYKFIVFDALRPQRVQKQLFAYVEGTPQEKYVANPKKGSMHSFGFAVDLSVLDDKGVELDMGTPFDDFTDLSQPSKEQEHLKAGKLTEVQVENRLILRKAMEDAGFTVLKHEWWHFDALPNDQVRRDFKIVE